MTDSIGAIDCMYYVATREFMEKWDQAKTTASRGEIECHEAVSVR